MTRTALVLAGHGSHISPNTAGVVWRYVDQLRALHVAGEVTAAFWKEMPSFHRVFDTLTVEDITVVPLFTAQGYFTRTVIPTEMGLTGQVTERNGVRIRYARTLSEHPYPGEIVRRQVEKALVTIRTEHDVPDEDVAVAIIGHSTRRDPESRRATEAQAQAIREAGIAGEVLALYLDDAPEIAEIYRLTRAPYLIAMPFFLAPGSHTTIDVPGELGVTGDSIPQQVNGRVVYYLPPLGASDGEDGLLPVIRQLAEEAGMPRAASSGSAWDCFPARGRDELVEVVQRRGKLTFGQLQLTPARVSKTGDDAPQTELRDSAALRAWVRENPFRSLATATDLPGGWYVPVERSEMLHAIVETVYPGAVADWAEQQRGMFTAGSFEATIGRQTGNYRKLAGMTAAQQAEITQGVCGGCVRAPVWAEGKAKPHPPAPSPLYGEGEKNGGSPVGKPEDTPTTVFIPCAEPCNHWLSRALESVE